MATTTAQIQQLYVAYLGRAADKAGLDYWSAQLNATNATLTLDDLRTNFTTQQAEYTDAYAGLSRSDAVIKIYNNLFGRAPDAAGLTYWTTGGGSTVQADQLLTAFIAGAAATDAQVVTNKVLVAEVYTSTAGDAYVKADAASIISTVTSNAASVGTALGHLSDGTLPGVAVPAGVAAVKAEAIAVKALADLKTGQITSLTDLNKAVIALNDKLPADKQLDDDDLAITPAGTTATYDEAHAAADNALAVRNAVSTDTVATLQANVTNTTGALSSARDAFVQAAGKTGNVDLAVAYEKAYTANEAVKAADKAAVTVATGKVDVDINAAVAADSTALAKANTAAGLTGSAAVTDGASLYKALTDGTKTADQIKAVSDAFGTFLGTTGASDYTALKALASTDYTKNVAVDNLSDAGTAVTNAGGSAYLTAYGNKVTADTTLANYNAADALVKQADALDVAVDASQEAATTAHTNLPAFAHDLAANADVHLNTGADLFYFADGVKGSDDWTITGFNKGDALYIGEGFTLATGVTVATDGTGNYVGTNAAVKEVFFLQDKTTGVVSAVIESNAVGHAAGGSDANVAVITLAGVTSLSDVSYANGVITSNHVAVA
ncbi:DUF4214 domain-containing protein [Pseudomonas sp. SLFW]|uniref:DUF4214 domain-containing protein n=1 Tax=Pseudomonas sp. SLFW TaxID=2683259 RepID=UPI0014122F11|nr:DUF4214 domain-containing protein [Pseudomonas sp. SLFW]NBB13720.1 DUF4214 domain-containing protein [Pseudomonas sp. SLFW]